ncbi:glycosyltransferase [Candidatus Woesearchaeota archaeon]|nr:glycosyltransferase [Candidatus Woesearchaeota archaeon]
MKIVILTTSFPGYEGHLQSPFIYKLAKSLSKENKVKVICPYYGKPSKKKEQIGNMEVYRFQYAPIRLQKLTAEGGIPSSLKESFIAKLNMPFFLVSFLIKSINKSRECDIIHAQWALSGLIGIIVKKIWYKPLIITTRGAAVNDAMKSKTMKKILLYIFNNTDFITPNNESHIEIIKQLGISEDKLSVVPNGVDIELFKPRNKEKIRRELNLPNDKKIILFVGWLIERKGVKYFLEAASRMIKENENTLFLIVGSGILEKELKKYAAELELDNYVKFLGAKNSEEIPYWMNASDIFILPSLSEGRPNVVAEAVSSGLPVIATRVNGTPELIDDGKTGFLIPVKDSYAIYEKLKIILENEKLMIELGKNARKFILKNGYTWDKCASQYLSIYKMVLSNFINIKE